MTKSAKIISILLLAIMVFSIAGSMIISSFAITAPQFALRKVSETSDKIVVELDLTSGTFNSLDVVFNMNGVTCDSIVQGDSKGMDMLLSSTNATGGRSHISAISISGAQKGTVATITLNKDSKATEHTFSITISDCAITDENNENKSVNPTVSGNSISGSSSNTTTTTKKTTTTLPTVKSPVFEIYQVDQYDDYIEVNIDLVENTFNSLDLIFEMEGLECYNIDIGDAVTSSDMMLTNLNPTRYGSHISIISINGMNVGTIAVVKLKVISNSYSFGVKSTDCAVTDSDNNNRAVNAIINGNIKGNSHTHQFIEIKIPSTCVAEGYECDLCVLCGKTRNLTNLPLAEHSWSEWRSTQVGDHIEEYHFCENCDKVEMRLVEIDYKVTAVDIGNITMNYKDTVTITPAISANSGAEYTVAYSSSNSSVATVDENGKVYATGTGHTTITCTVTDKYGNIVADTCDVEVKYTALQWIIIIVLFGWIWY